MLGRTFSIERPFGVQSAVAQARHQASQGDGISLDDENSPSAPRSGHHQRLAGFTRRRQFEGETEHGAATFLADHRHLAGHQLDELARNRQSQPGTAVFAGCCRIGLFERRKDLAELIPGDSDTGVADLEAEYDVPVPVGQTAETQRDRTGMGELERIADDVGENLPNPPGVAGQAFRNGRIGAPDVLQPLFGGTQGVEVGEVFEQVP